MGGEKLHATVTELLWRCKSLTVEKSLLQTGENSSQSAHNFACRRFFLECLSSGFKKCLLD
jgi:hypothetical protein